MEKINVYIVDVRPLAGLEDKYLPLLTEERRRRLLSMPWVEERLRCAAAGLLLRKFLKVDSDACLRRNRFGKPELAGEGPCFSLSHGGNYALLAISSGPVGADIEAPGELPDPMPPVFSPGELDWIGSDPERFAILWTRLESILKARGRGFEQLRRDFSLMENGRWRLHSQSWRGHIVSLAYLNDAEIILNNIEYSELIGG